MMKAWLFNLSRHAFIIPNSSFIIALKRERLASELKLASLFRIRTTEKGISAV
jgi:hypothetical protein